MCEMRAGNGAKLGPKKGPKRTSRVKRVGQKMRWVGKEHLGDQYAERPGGKQSQD